MNVLIVDTSVWIQYFKGTHLPDIDLALKEGRVYLPPLVASELMSSSKTKSKEKKQLEAFLLELPLCDMSIEHCFRVGELRAKAAAKGLDISTPDAHIAQCTLDLEGYLLSLDKVFLNLKKITPELKIIY